MQKPERVYQIVEVGEKLGVTRQRVVWMIRHNKIPTPIRCGDSYVLTDLDVSMLRVVIEAQGTKWKRKNKNNEIKSGKSQ